MSDPVELVNREVVNVGPATADNLYRLYTVQHTLSEQCAYVQALIKVLVERCQPVSHDGVERDRKRRLDGMIRDQVIRNRYKAGESQSTIARDYGITQPAVSRIVNSGSP